MTVTPWGDASRLRSRKLSPGPGKGRSAVRQNQRERLYAATVAVVAEKGYEATRVEDILVLAGVSRNAFYKLFSNKRDCFVATLEAINGFAVPAVVGAFEQTPGPWDRKLAATLDLLANVIVAQPAMARVAWVEFYAAGPDAMAAVDVLDRAIEDIACRALKESPEQAGMPREVVRAVVGGVRKIVHARLIADRADELAALMPELFAWMQSYRTPAERLQRSRHVPPELVVPPRAPRNARERMLRAVVEIVAEKGYAEMAITDIATRGAVSLTTFYAHFDGKEAALLAALEDAERHVFTATAERFVAAPDWPTAVASSMRAFLGFLATHPAIARLGSIGIWETGPAGAERRAQGVALFQALLDDGFRQFPATKAVAAEAIGATVDALLLNSLRHKGAERLYEEASTAIFITLAPFVGTEHAVELANAPVAGIGQTTL